MSSPNASASLTAAGQEATPVDDQQPPGKFCLSDSEFAKMQKIIRDMTGISMSDAKRQLVYRRVEGRLKALGMTSFKDYLAFLESGHPDEVELFSNAVTTNLTSFFRENHHFEFLRDTILPEIVKKKAKGAKRLRIWSAGCSTGEEPYSLAITLSESMRNLAGWDAKLLCTDLDSDVLATASKGIYPIARIEKVPVAQKKRWFQKCDSQGEQQVRVRDELRDLIVFKQLNLMHEWPMRGKFDIIFCRNVIIYFDKPTQRVLMERYAQFLEDGGYLIIGHSESLYNVSNEFDLLGKTIYRKKIK